MPQKIFIVNVGVNASHSLKSPIFEDGTFEFIPIPENRVESGKFTLTYSDLRSFYNPEESLSKYIPHKYHSHPVHNDPEFFGSTYGDNCELPGRARGLRSVKEGDIILFYARLVNYNQNQFTNVAGFYFIGFIEVSLIVENVLTKPASDILSLISNNAHIRRGLSNPRYFNGFWVFKGSAKSRRFRMSVPLTRQLAEHIFLTKMGCSWEWKEQKSDLQTIGSYMRSCRCYIDTKTETGNKQATILWGLIQQYNPELTDISAYCI
ncbi:MAG: hypothetical protein AB1480_03745 [Nitrospirota bacterium]